MEADDALELIDRARQRPRRLNESATEFLDELAEDLRDARKVELTQEDVHELKIICLRVGIVWEEPWTPDLA